MKLQLCTPSNAGRYIPANMKEIEFRMNRNREEEKGKKGGVVAKSNIPIRQVENH
jgi:hypothetical protein